MAKRKVNVKGYKRKDGTQVRGYTKELDNLKDYEPLSDGWVKRISKKDLILSEDEWAMAHFGSSEPYPSYEEYLNNLNLQEVKARKRHERIKELEKKMTPEQLKKLKIHYGMGVSGEFGRAERINIKGEKDGKKKN